MAVHTEPNVAVNEVADTALSAVSDGARARVGRVGEIDLLRGLMVALMALDHVREYFSWAALRFEPTDMFQTTPPLFVTRWVTHLCAPTFVLLAGVSVYLQRSNGLTGPALRARLLKRGAWLILLEISVVGFAFNFAEPFLFLQVIWAIGVGMVMLALLLPAGPIALAGIGVALIALNLTISHLVQPYAPAILWQILFAPGPITPMPGVVAYPAVPWTGILLLGYGAAPLIATDRAHLRRRALMVAVGLLSGFVALRLAGIGDPRPWGVGKTETLRALSFFNVTKYPPTVPYVMMTVGVSALLLAAFTTMNERGLPMLRAFGRAPFFTYIVHIFLIHTSALVVGLALGFPARDFTGFIESSAALKDAGWGFGLPVVLAIWAVTLLALRPLAIWFARVKMGRSYWWLSYL